VRSTRTDQPRLVRPDSRATSGRWTRRTEDTRTWRGAWVRRRATGLLPPPTPPPTPNRNEAAFLILFRCLLWTKCCSGLTAGKGGRWCLYQPPHSYRMSGYCEGAWDAHIYNCDQQKPSFIFNNSFISLAQTSVNSSLFSIQFKNILF
jgi:hypothetical protein